MIRAFPIYTNKNIHPAYDTHTIYLNTHQSSDYQTFPILALALIDSQSVYTLKLDACVDVLYTYTERLL